VADATTYTLDNTITGQQVELYRAFSPESLVPGDFTQTPSGCAPASFAELRKLLRGSHWVVLDDTIPFVWLDPDNPITRELEEGLGRPLAFPNDLVQCLLAWVAGVEGLQWLSAFGTASLLRGESSHWVRDAIGSRFSVRAVIEVGGVLPDVHPAMRFCIIHLGSAPGAAFLSSIAGREDARHGLREATGAARQFFSGHKPDRGFTAEVARTGLWAVGIYDPELDKLEACLGASAYHSIYESDYENTSCEPTLGEPTPLWMRVWQIAESLGAGTSGAPVPSERYRHISVASSSTAIGRMGPSPSRGDPGGPIRKAVD
jgi:hypothetical protein